MTVEISPIRAGARGLVGAMAMSGFRELTTSLGWLERTPPEEIVEDQAPKLVRSLSADREEVVIQLAHLAYGTGAGAAFGLLPEGVRRSRLSGPGYGLATWLLFELGIAPALGVSVARRRTVMSRVMLVADHLIYGLVVAGQLAPEPAPETEPDDDAPEERDA